jgi:hypothetical protein
MRAIEGGGLEEKKCGIQQKRCITSISHATFDYQEVASAIPQMPISIHLVPALRRGNADLLSQTGTLRIPTLERVRASKGSLGERALYN